MHMDELVALEIELLGAWSDQDREALWQQLHAVGWALDHDGEPAFFLDSDGRDRLVTGVSSALAALVAIGAAAVLAAGNEGAARITAEGAVSAATITAEATVESAWIQAFVTLSTREREAAMEIGELLSHGSGRKLGLKSLTEVGYIDESGPDRDALKILKDKWERLERHARDER